MPTNFLRYKKRSGLTMTFILLLGFALSAGAPVKNQEKKLPEILKGTARYCEKLKTKVFHFLCREEIVETCEKAYDYPNNKQGLKDFLERNKPKHPTDDLDTNPKMDRLVESLRKNRIRGNYNYKKHEQKNIYVNEYRILKDGGRINEERTVIRMNGKNVRMENPGLLTYIYSYQNTLSPIYLFAGENQGKYRYKLLKKEKTMNRNAYVIEVKSKRKNKSKKEKMAVAWVDMKDFSILKLEVLPGAFKGYDYLLKVGENKTFDVKINDVHYFGIQKNGLRFPSQTEIRLSYKQDPPKGIYGAKHGAILITNLTTNYTYLNYLFYKVKVGEPVFKTVYKN